MGGAAFQSRIPDKLGHSFAGVCIGDSDDYARAHHSAKKSTDEHPQILREYINKEVSKGRVIGPLPNEISSLVHISPCGVISKSQLGKMEIDC